MRDLFTDLANSQKKQKKQDEQKENEAKLKTGVDVFRRKTSEEVASALLNLGSTLSRETIEGAITKSINDNSSGLGIKSIVDSQKRKLLISQTLADKAFSDIIYQMLLHNNAPPEDILYKKKPRATNKAYLGTLIPIRNS